tara:strand:+ start:2491 stop:2898 length:408 start_codon:yes stop_codon:yes gene_type:complete
MNFDINMWLVLALCVSIVANILGFWYIRRLLSKFVFISQNLGDLVSLVMNYKSHLQSIYKLEQYYGDEDIRFLISHTNSLLEMLEDYEDIYSISIPLEIDEEQGEEIEQENNLDAEETQINEENVFYAGARERNS